MTHTPTNTYKHTPTQGQKLQYGHVPLYASGDDANAKSFRSLHAVQRHMVDAGKCKMLYDGNEEEYAEFYDYEETNEEEMMDMDAASSERGILCARGVNAMTDGTTSCHHHLHPPLLV